MLKGPNLRHNRPSHRRRMIHKHRHQPVQRGHRCTRRNALFRRVLYDTYNRADSLQTNASDYSTTFMTATIVY